MTGGTVNSDGLTTGWRRYPAGTPEHYAGYEQEFAPETGMPDDPRACYEIDYSDELAFDAYVESGGWGEAGRLEAERAEDEIMPLLTQAEPLAVSWELGTDPYNPYNPYQEPEKEIELF